MRACQIISSTLQTDPLDSLYVLLKDKVNRMTRSVSSAGVERIAGLTWRPVAVAAEVASALAHGTKQRATSATAMNATSSRSHAVLSVKLAFADGSQSLLHLVDLAGRCSATELVKMVLCTKTRCTNIKSAVKLSVRAASLGAA